MIDDALAALISATGYARHVVKLMWLKSTVSKSKNNNKITREAQGQIREVLSGSSVDQTYELMNKNVIGGVDDEMSGPRIAKSFGQVVYVNGAVAYGQFNYLCEEASIGGWSGLQSARVKPSSDGSDAVVIIDGGVSRGHISRGDEPTKSRTDSRSGEGLQYVCL